MKVFVYEDAGRICVGTESGELDIIESADISIPKGSDYIILNDEDLPKEPQESWYIEEGKIKIDQDRLAAYNRSIMPDLTPIEFDMKLRKAGMLQTVRDYVATNEVMEIAYTRATFFSRTDPFIETARIELGLTEDQVDQIWTG